VHPQRTKPKKLTPDVDIPVRSPRTGVNAASDVRGLGVEEVVVHEVRLLQLLFILKKTGFGLLFARRARHKYCALHYLYLREREREKGGCGATELMAESTMPLPTVGRSRVVRMPLCVVSGKGL